MTAAVLLVAFLSLVLHELGHAGTALALGDTTAYDRGRLTLNPLAHVDPFLTIVCPAVTLLFSGGAWVFGGARPLPVDRSRLGGGTAGYLAVVLAGPLTSLAVAGLAHTAGLTTAVHINLAIAAFNLLPIPPLDGWNIARVIMGRCRG